jgi:hypothetical protein
VHYQQSHISDTDEKNKIMSDKCKTCGGHGEVETECPVGCMKDCEACQTKIISCPDCNGTGIIAIKFKNIDISKGNVDGVEVLTEKLDFSFTENDTFYKIIDKLKEAFQWKEYKDILVIIGESQAMIQKLRKTTEAVIDRQVAEIERLQDEFDKHCNRITELEQENQDLDSENELAIQKSIADDSLNEENTKIIFDLKVEIETKNTIIEQLNQRLSSIGGQC